MVITVAVHCDCSVDRSNGKIDDGVFGEVIYDYCDNPDDSENIDNQDCPNPFITKKVSNRRYAPILPMANYTPPPPPEKSRPLPIGLFYRVIQTQSF